MAILNTPSLPRARRRRTYQRATFVAQARHRRAVPRSERSWIYRATGTATFWVLAFAAYCAAGAALAGLFIGLTTDTGRTVVAIIAVTIAAVLGIRTIEGVFNR